MRKENAEHRPNSRAPMINNTCLIISRLLISLFFTWTSCNAQPPTPSTHNQSIQNDSGVELSKNIMLVYQDKKNNYWFGSWEDGLYKYDGKTLLHFTDKDGFPHKRINEIKEDRSGNIYFNTSEGISRYDGRTFTILIETKNDSNHWELKPGDLWFWPADYSGEVYRYDGKYLFKLAIPHTKTEDKLSLRYPGAIGDYEVYTIYKDSYGNVWFGTNPAGVCRYNGVSFDWIAEEDVTEYHNGPANGVRSIIEDKEGYFWFNSKYRYKINDSHSSQQPFYTREKSIGSLDGSPDDNLIEYMSIARTNDDNLWIATYGNGVWRYDPNLPDGKNITYYPVTNGKEDITLFSIYKDNQGDLWLGTHENGVYKFNGKTFERFKP